MMGRAILQPSLTISTPGDRFEVEADRVADDVMRMPDRPGPRPQIQRFAQVAAVNQQCASRAARDTAGGDLSSVVARGTSGGGQALDDGTRTFMESRFGRDFGHVRVHTGGGAAESARSINALAYTVGSDVVFGVGRYAPQTGTGRRLIAHELAHVVQQRNAPPKASSPQAIQRQYDSDETSQDEAETTARPGSERESQSINITEDLFEEDPNAAGQMQRFSEPSSQPLIQRQPPSIPPPPPAFPSIYEWFFHVSGDTGEAFDRTCKDGRERGFYVMWNENSNKSSAGPLAIGDPAKGCVPASIQLGPRPYDSKPNYQVGWFHTHPLANPGCVKVEVGPSAVDKNTSKDNNLPGLVADTKTPTSTCRDFGYFFFGPTRRSY